VPSRPATTPTPPISAWRSPPRTKPTYVVNCFRDRWWEGWIRRGWVNSARKPVANRDLWEPFVELVRVRGDVTFRWIKAHAGHAMNELVDRLAVEAAQTQRSRSGVAR
jgi:ribonuclease HI